MPSYILTVQTREGVRYIGREFSILRAKADAMEYDDVDAALRRQAQLSKIWPDKSFGIEMADGAATTFRKENGY